MKRNKNKIIEPERPGICEYQNDGFGCPWNSDHKNFDKKYCKDCLKDEIKIIKNYIKYLKKRS